MVSYDGEYCFDKNAGTDHQGDDLARGVNGVDIRDRTPLDDELDGNDGVDQDKQTE